jgi:AraC-like DNA-binding protein
MQVEAEGRKSKATLYLPLAGSMKISAGGKSLSAAPGRPVLIPAGMGHRFRATRIQCLLFEISAAKWHSTLDLFLRAASAIPPLAWQPRSPDARAISDVLTFALRDAERDAGACQEIHRHRLESLILSVIARAVAARCVAPTPGEIPGRVSLDAITGWIAGRLPSDFKTADIARFAGVTRRTLQTMFLRHLHTTPAHYVRDLRMDAARADLLDPKNTKTVSEIAMTLNFLHLGRFAASYRAKFGESPSDTIRRREAGQPSKKRRQISNPGG